jgi:hypothetical protein
MRRKKDCQHTFGLPRAGENSLYIECFYCGEKRPFPPMEEMKGTGTRSRWWNDMVEILESRFPKGRCKERGMALILLIEAEKRFREAERLLAEQKDLESNN